MHQLVFSLKPEDKISECWTFCHGKKHYKKKRLFIQWLKQKLEGWKKYEMLNTSKKSTSTSLFQPSCLSLHLGVRPLHIAIVTLYHFITFIVSGASLMILESISFSCRVILESLVFLFFTCKHRLQYLRRLTLLVFNIFCNPFQYRVMYVDLCGKSQSQHLQ